MFPENSVSEVIMQQSEKATVDVQFTDLPNALIACRVPEDLFNEGSKQVRSKCSKPQLTSAPPPSVGLRWIIYER